MDIYLKILAFAFMITGITVTYAAKFFVKRYNLTEKVNMPEGAEMTEAEETKYRLDNAVLKVKMVGAAVCVPGAVLIFVLWR